MVYNTEFKSLVSAKEKYASTSDKSKQDSREWNKDKLELARTLNTFGGKRLLGMTDSNKPIWISYTIDRQTMTISVSLSHSIDTILKSKLCPRRITAGINESVNLEHAMRPPQKNDNGVITPKSIDYAEKLMTIAQSPTIGKVNGQCSSLLFMYVSNFIHAGSTDDGKVRWYDIKKAWNIPSGSYFTIYG